LCRGVHVSASLWVLLSRKNLGPAAATNCAASACKVQNKSSHNCCCKEQPTTSTTSRSPPQVRTVSRELGNACKCMQGANVESMSTSCTNGAVGVQLCAAFQLQRSLPSRHVSRQCWQGCPAAASPHVCCDVTVVQRSRRLVPSGRRTQLPECSRCWGHCGLLSGCPAA
jgi:hypothetical protein